MFLDAKRVEGCSRTYHSILYKVTAEHMLSQTEKEIRKITTDEMRSYLCRLSKGIIARMLQLIIYDGIYRAFTWLEEEDYILKSPMRRIHKIKTKNSGKKKCDHR